MSIVAVGTDLQSLPLEAMIGGPMQSAIRAQMLAADATAEFITNVGLETIVLTPAVMEPDGKTVKTPAKTEQKARTVDFSYVRSVPDPTDPNKFTPTPTSLTVPLLAILPIPFLRIRDMNIMFEFKITNTQLATSDSKLEVGGALSIDNKKVKLKIHASYTYQKSVREETDRSATLKVTVNAVQDAIPEGLSRVLTLLQDGIITKPVQTS
jgi:hypothetical protein